MYEWAPNLAMRRISRVASSLSFSFLFLALVLADSRSAAALPIPTAKVYAIPAFARKYGMPCSACHEAWPKFSPFGQWFKDNGYQLGNDRDAPIFQQPAYWPVTFRTTPLWHRESSNRVQVDGPLGQNTAEGQVTTHGFDFSGLDILTAGTLAKNISFLFTPSADNTGAFHIESANLRFSNLLKSSWLNIRVGKFELDNLHSEKRALTLSNQGGSYQNYHFQPLTESSYVFGIGDNQVGVEWMGHSKDDRTRLSASLLSANDGQPGLPTSRGYETFLAGSRAFEVGSLGLQRVGGFAYFGQAPTFFQFTQGGAPVAGAGIGNKGYYRAGLIGMWYVKKLDVTTMYFHGSDSAFLGTNTPANSPLPTGAQAPTWNGGLFETHYTLNPQFILINRYELIRMSSQAAPVIPGSIGVTTASGSPIVIGVPASDFGNTDSLVFGYRYYPFISTRAGFAFHTEYAIVRTRKTAPVSGLDLTSSSLMFGFDFDY
jgi:hypothetical protein